MLHQLLQTIRSNYRRRKQKLHEISISKPTFIDDMASFKFNSKIKIGKYCRIGYQCYLNGEGAIEIGDGTILAPFVVILSSTHNYKTSDLLPYGNEEEKRPVKIGKGSWIGWGALICPGVTIGNGAVIAMGSVVTKDVADGEVVGGNPAKVLKTRGNEININAMIANEKFFLKEVLEKKLKREGRQINLREILED